MQWNFWVLWSRGTENTNIRIMDARELCSCATAATADQFSTKSFNLETQQWLWTDEPAASWQPWLLLGFVSAGGSEPRNSPANETVLALPLYSWSQLTLPCISFPGTYAFLLFPWRPSLGRHEVTSHRVLTSVWVLNARSANTLCCVEYAGYVYSAGTARFQGRFSKGRQTFSI